MTIFEPILQQQSPIHIDTRSTYHALFHGTYLEILYPGTELPGRFEDHEFKFATPPAIRLDGALAFLDKVHVHHRSEHQIDGRDFDFELHFVHRLDQPVGASAQVVLAVFVTVKHEAASHAKIRAFDQKLLAWSEDPSKPPDLAPIHFLPPEPLRCRFFRYEGSLTTDPFTQSVRWLVFRDPIVVHEKDIEQLKLHAEKDARPLMPLDRRYSLRSFDP